MRAAVRIRVGEPRGAEQAEAGGDPAAASALRCRDDIVSVARVVRDRDAELGLADVNPAMRARFVLG